MTDKLFSQLYVRGAAISDIYRCNNLKCYFCDRAAIYRAVAKHKFPGCKEYKYSTPMCFECKKTQIWEYRQHVMIAAAPVIVKPLNPWIRSSICLSAIFVPLIVTIVKHPALKPEPNNSFYPAYNPPLVFTPVSPITGPTYAEQRAKSAEETEDMVNRSRAREIIDKFRAKNK